MTCDAAGPEPRADEGAPAPWLSRADVVAGIGHELRTPLHGVLGLRFLMLQGELQPEQRRRLQAVHQAAQSMQGLLDELLDLARAESGRMEIEHVPLRVDELLDGIGSLMGAQAQAKGLTLQVERSPLLPECIVGDPLRLRQVLLNLVGNAIKFTDSGGVVVGAAPVDTGRALRFEVRDSGIGIAPQALPRLFQPYAQADATIARRFGGSGLGLALSQRLAGLMGGRIDVDSAPGRGSRFSLTLPLQA